MGSIPVGDSEYFFEKITREYRLVRDFNFIILYEVSRNVLPRCNRTDTFVNKFKMFARKLISHKAYRPTRSENA